MAFKDHFSADSSAYARYRPICLAPLFAYLASLCTHHDQAWDCATGSGQAARSLACHFTEVIATDASDEQIRNGGSHQGITFWVSPAENSEIELFS